MKRTSRIAALAVVAVAVLGGCAGKPSNKVLARDYIEGLEGLTAQERTCMLEELDTYTADQLQQIGENNDGISPTSPGDADLQKFEADLNSCMGDG